MKILKVKNTISVLQTSLEPSLTLSEEEQKQQQNRLFNNPLISESDLLISTYDTKIINNIDKFKGTDHCGRSRCNLGGCIWRCLYCNYCYGGSDNNNYTYMA